MKQSYISNYLQIYLWKGISVILNLLALFIVIPFLSNNKTIFGIYSVVLSTVIFLSYADIGFIGAGNKYAAEAFALKDRVKEIKLLGFVHFILFLFVGVIALTFIGLSFSPDLLIRDIHLPDEIQVASKLLLIQGIFSFTIVIQRLNDAIYGIRLEDFVYRRIHILGSFCKIISVFYFFSAGKYDIVNYFLLLKLIDVVVNVIGLLLARKKYNYDFKLFFKSFRFSKEAFNITKALAFSSFYVTILWILYYELDSIMIGKLIGAEAVAVYAIGFTLLTYYRNISAIIFAPFQVRYNHFVGQGDMEGLKSFLLRVIKLTYPFIVFSVVPLTLLIEPFVYSWVGETYTKAVPIARLLIVGNIFLFLMIPGANLVTSLVKIKELAGINTIITIIFWIGIISTLSYWQVLSFAIFKLVSFLIATACYAFLCIKFLDITYFKFFKETILDSILILIILIIVLYSISSYLPTTKSSMNLLIVGFTIGGSAGLSMISFYYTSKHFREVTNGILIRLIPERFQFIIKK